MDHDSNNVCGGYLYLQYDFLRLLANIFMIITYWKYEDIRKRRVT